VTPAEES